MTPHLYVLALGPVQDFIAAARTTRDLWFGSYLLSEIGKAAAKKIAEDGGKLIFPALTTGALGLKPGNDPDAFNVANIILVELPDSNDPKKINEQAQQAARKRWREFADPAKEIAKSVVDDVIWKDQIDDVIEFYAAWTPLPSPTEYARTRTRLMRMLAARKSTRDFKPATIHWGCEKSSLDGARESVLIGNLSKDLIIRMRLKESEELCAVGLTKRLGSGKISFPSVVRVAADPWIRDILNDKDARQILNQIGEFCKNHPNIASKYSGKVYQEFPYDGQILYPARLESMMKQPNPKQGAPKSWTYYLEENERKSLDNVKTLIERLYKGWTDSEGNRQLGYGEPNPYLAILVADGDQMGKAISSINSADRHRNFSGKLSAFANEAKSIVESHHGCTVYTGGDDVLAFIPVDTCIYAARALHETFGSILNNPNGEYKSPTLSVGIAIVHSLDPLEDILNYGRDAEHNAKSPDRNGLAIHLHTRNGSDPIRIREQWAQRSTTTGTDEQGTPGPMPLDQRLEEWVQMYHADRFPDGAAYDLRELAKVYEGWEKTPIKLLTDDVSRLLKRKRVEGGKTEIEDKDLRLLTADITSHEILTRRAEELVLCRRIAEISRQHTVSALQGESP